jgi:hypothetical protein
LEQGNEVSVEDIGPDIYASNRLNALLFSYCKRLGIVSHDFQPNYTNDFLSWKPDAEVEDPDAKQREVAAYQKEVAAGRESILSKSAPIAVGS